jgi:hypothetical protein
VSASTPRLTQLTRSVAVVAKSPQLAQVVQVSVTASIVAAPPDSAGDPCRTSQRQENGKDAFGITLFWFKMQTSWCWDYRKVTGHTTRIYWGVTGPGAAFGWAYVSNSGIYFNCYVAYGSTRNWSGNHEEATASFLNVVTLQTCRLSLKTRITEVSSLAHDIPVNLHSSAP